MALVVEYSREMSRVVPILLYHSIAEDVPPAFSEWAVSPAVFADQMISLFEHRYTPITVSQLSAAMTGSNERLPDRPVVITFDDGFADFYTAALPILKRYGFPATLYIPTGIPSISSSESMVGCPPRSESAQGCSGSMRRCSCVYLAA